MVSNLQTTKYTATIPIEYVNELKDLTQMKIIPSVNFAIREAISLYLSKTKQELYEQKMKEAATDEVFMQRTLDCDKDFAFVDSEADCEW